MSDDKESLKKELDKYKSIVENQFHQVSIRDENSVLIFANKAYCNYFGVEKEIIGTKFIPDIRNEDMIRFLNIISSLTPENNRATIELRWVDKNNDVHWIHSEIKGLFDDKRCFRGYQSTACDITERKLIELKMKEREEMYRKSYKHFPVPSFTLKKIENKFILIDYNEYANKITQNIVQKLIGISLDELYNDRQEIIEDVKYCFTYKTKLIKEMRYKFKFIKDLEKDLVITYAYAPKNYVFVHAKDITDKKHTEKALKQSEYIYRQLFEKNSAIKLLVDKDTGNIVKANSKACEFYGYPLRRLEKMNIKKINPFISDSELSKIRQNDHNDKPYHFKHKTASGEIKDVEVNVCTLRIEGQELYYSIIHDVTKQHQMMNELKKKNAELKYFAHTISHEIKTPLASVMSYLRVIERTFQMDSEMLLMNRKVKHRILKMSDMINALLEYSNIEHKSLFITNNIETLIKEAMDNLEDKLMNSKIKISYEGLPSIKCDKMQIISLFQNLIENAVKYTNKEITNIYIKAVEKEDYWLFSVKDNGIGINSENKKNIFNIFQRYDDNDEFSGYGIGLSFCKRIVENHNGEIWVDSVLNKGSTFYFTISKKLTLTTDTNNR